MECQVDSTELKTALGFARKVVKHKKSILPILSHVLLDASEGRLRVRASDLEVSYTADVAAQVAKPGRFTVPAKDLHQFVSDVKAHSPLTLNHDGGSQLAVQNGHSGTKLLGLPADEFPVQAAMPEKPRIKFKVPPGLLRRLLTVRECASQGETQYFINSVYIHVTSDAIRFVATDSHRMACQSVKAASPKGTNTGAIVPLSGVKFLEALLPKKGGPESVTIAFEGRTFFAATSGGVQIAVRLVDGEYPAYEQIMPKEHPHWARFDSAELLAALDAVGTTANPKTRSSHWMIEGASCFLSTSSDKGRSDVQIACESNGDAGLLGFCVDYVHSAVRILNSSTVEMQYKDPLNATVWRAYPYSERAQVLVMPTRIK